MKKLPTYKFFLSAIVFIFVTLVVMNSVQSFTIVAQIGMYGKVIFSGLGILGCLVFLHNNPIRVVLRNQYLLGTAYALILIFSIFFAVRYSDSDKLLFNLVFPIYLVFYYLVYKSMLRVQFDSAGLETAERGKLMVLKAYRAALLVNTVVWFAIALAGNVFMYDAGGFGGFFVDKIHFGLYAATGFLVCFYLRYHERYNDRSWSNLLQILLYLALVIFTSRNAIFICATAILYYFFLSRIKSGFLIFLLLLVGLIALYYQEIFLDISPKTINELSTGRFEIWRLALKAIFENGILWGNGLFNLNSIVLSENIGTGFYYLDTLDFLYFHSSYIEILAGGGIVLLVLFVLIMLNTWPVFSRMDKTILIPILWGALVESYLAQPFLLISSLFYFLLMANSSIVRIKRTTVDNLKPIK